MSCNCGKCYVDQTKRTLRIRLDEHFKNFNLNEKFHNQGGRWTGKTGK